MNKRHMDVQIMIIITPQENQNTITWYTRSNQQNKFRFNRFILYCVIAGNYTLVYIMITAEINGRVFHQYLVLRDNGVIEIGSFTCVLVQYKIERNMQGIPLIRINYPAFASCPPLLLSTVHVNTDLEGNQSLAGVWNNSHLTIN